MVTARSPYRQMKGNMTIMTALHAVPSEAIASDLSDDPDLTEEASSPDEAEVERGTIDYREAFGVGSAFESDLQRALLNRPEPPEIIMLEVHNGCVTYGVLVLEGDEYRQAEIHRKMHKYVWNIFSSVLQTHLTPEALDVVPSIKVIWGGQLIHV